jgi:hypothetical protein
VSPAAPSRRPPRRRATLAPMAAKKTPPAEPERRHGNPPDSPWYSTPKDQRVAKTRTLTVDDETWGDLAALAGAEGESRSAWVTRVVAEAKARAAKKK